MLKTLLTTVVVTVGMLVGLTSTAFANGPQVTLCHKPGTPAEMTKTVPVAAVPGHLGHGDTLGPCATVQPNPPAIPVPPGVPGVPGAPGADGRDGAPGVTTIITRVEQIGPKVCHSRRVVRPRLPKRFAHLKKVTQTIDGKRTTVRVPKNRRMRVSLRGLEHGVYALVFSHKGVKRAKYLYTVCAHLGGSVDGYNR